MGQGSGMSLEFRALRKPPPVRDSVTMQRAFVVAVTVLSVAAMSAGPATGVRSACHVPRITGLTLSVAREPAAHAGCTLRVKGAALKQSSIQTVDRQLPAAGGRSSSVTLWLNPFCRGSAAYGPGLRSPSSGRGLRSWSAASISTVARLHSSRPRAANARPRRPGPALWKSSMRPRERSWQRRPQPAVTSSKSRCHRVLTSSWVRSSTPTIHQRHPRRSSPSKSRPATPCARTSSSAFRNRIAVGGPWTADLCAEGFAPGQLSAYFTSWATMAWSCPSLCRSER